MKYYLLLAAAFGVMAAPQEQARNYSTYSYDLNGNRVAVSSATAQGGFQAQTIKSINGRNVPVETVEETVISQDSGGRVVERIIRPHDANGRPGAPQKLRIEETNNADGTVNRSTSVYEADLNGRFALRERATTTVSKSGEVERAETRVEVPNINGSLEVSEMSVKVVMGDEKQSHTDVTVLRRDTNGSFTEAARQLIETKVHDSQTITTTAEYNAAVTGKMEFTGQRVARSSKNPDGSEIQVVDVYGTVIPGRTMNANRSGPQLREQQVIEKRVGADNTVVETFSVRRANLESGALGAAQTISETVCSGACLPPPPAPAAPEPPAPAAEPRQPPE
ncbi:MAG: hypothetical protein FJW20_02615 [Acidimicrobiia bacterium]|nr:hypothetical protein [Acidimicrobiia bacterium]